MKRLFLLPLLAAALVFTGCDEDNVTGLSNGIQSNLGVSVQLNTDDNDRCMYLQLQSMAQDFGKLTAKSKAKVKARLGSYKKLVLDATTNSQVITGQVTMLYYVVQNCGNGTCYFSRVTDAQKAVEDTRKIDGNAPASELTKGETLALTPHTSRDESLRRDYYTLSVPIYDKSDAITDNTFIQARQQGTIFLNKENATPETTCGRMLSLSEVVGSDAIELQPRSGN